MALKFPLFKREAVFKRNNVNVLLRPGEHRRIYTARTCVQCDTLSGCFEFEVGFQRAVSLVSTNSNRNVATQVSRGRPVFTREGDALIPAENRCSAKEG